MESCALSGAQWHFSKTNGALSFESYGNVIYRVANGNGEYHDYLSFFQYGDEELYYMISTFGEYYASSSLGTPALLSASRYCGTGNSNQAARKYKFASLSSALSLSQFSDTGPFSSGSWPDYALACSSQFTDYEMADTDWGSVYENSTAFNNYSGLYSGTNRLGCVTKGKDIVWFNGASRNKCCIESGDAFSNFCDPDDTYGIIKLVLGFNEAEGGSSGENASHTLHYFNAECLASNGARAYGTNWNSNAYSNFTVIPDYGAYIYSGGSKVPFSSMYLSTLGINGYNISNNRINQKGLIKNELLCANVYVKSSFSSTPTINSPLLGGNILCAAKSLYTGLNSLTIHNRSAGYKVPCIAESNTYPDNNIGICCYVGWDPSNPDITNESSWPELALQ